MTMPVKSKTPDYGFIPDYGYDKNQSIDSVFDHRSKQTSCRDDVAQDSIICQNHEENLHPQLSPGG